MPITPEQAKAELARRELARRELSRREAQRPKGFEASAQGQRESDRPDMMAELRKKTEAPYTSVDPGQLTSRMFGTGLTAIGVGGQAQENFMAAPVVNKIRALKGEKLGPTDILGHELGQNKTEFGDIARELGMPEWVAAPAGLAAASYADPLQSGYKIGSKVASGVEKTGSAIQRGIAHIFNVMGLGHNIDETKHLVETGYKTLDNKTLTNVHEVAQDTGNAMVKQLNTLFKKPAQKLYDNIAPKIAARKLTTAENQEIVKSLSETLGKERNAAAVQKIIDTDIGKSVVPKPTVKKSYVKKTIKGTTYIEEKGKSIDTGTAKSSQAIEETTYTDPFSLEPVGPEITKEVYKKELTRSARAAAVTKPRTVQNLLEDVAAGKPVNARDWDTVSQELKRISGVAQGKDPTASKAAEAIDKVLHTYVPELKEASSAWAKYLTAETQLKNVIGDWDEEGRVMNPDNLLHYFKSGPASVVRGNLDQFDLSVRNQGSESLLPAVKDAAAYATNVTPFRPALTALSLGGGLGVLADKAGVPKPISAAAGLFTAGGFTPWLSAKYSQGLARNAVRLRRIIEAPAGRYLMNNAPGSRETKLIREAVAQVLGRGITQAGTFGVTGRNKQLSEFISGDF